MTLTADEYRQTIATESATLRRAAARAGLDAAVPSCPDWTVAELLAHMGRVYRWAAACAVSDEPVSPHTIPATPGPEHLDGWVADGAALILDALDRPADTPAWTWAPGSTVGFWQRRQAHETEIHRVDAELAGGPPTPVPAERAADGIDEWLALVPYRLNTPPATGQGETVHLHCTDTPGEWLIRLTPEGPEVQAIHAKGDVALRGPASDLLLVALHRLGPDRVEVLGDAGVLDGFLAQTRF